MRITSPALALLTLLALSQPAWACKNAMEATGPNAWAFWVGVAALSAIVFFVGLFLYSSYTSKD